MGRLEQDWMSCLERDQSLFNLPIEEKQCTLAAKKSGKWFRRVEEAAEQYMRHWFAKVKKNVANDERLRYKMRSDLTKTPWGPTPGGGGRGVALKEA